MTSVAATKVISYACRQLKCRIVRIEAAPVVFTLHIIYQCRFDSYRPSFSFSEIEVEVHSETAGPGIHISRAVHVVVQPSRTSYGLYFEYARSTCIACEQVHQVDLTQYPEAFALKMLFTVLTMTTGYKGGEIVPTFFVGATFGCLMGQILHISPSLAAACGMAAMAGMMKALAGKATKTIGNFWVFLTRSVTRILMPLSLAVGILLVINGTPMSFDGKQTLTTLEGAEQVISQGPTAAIVPIKQLGTNGGGYFGTNSAHPLENPNAFTNILECWSILILPMAMVFAFGFYTRRRRLAAWIFGVMLLAYTAGVVLSVWQETGGSRQIDGMGISQELGSMEGKEIRIGSAASAMWGMTTTVTSNGSVNSMHDSQTPLSGMLQIGRAHV